MDELLFKNKYLQQQKQNHEQQQQQKQNIINIDGTSLQLASKLRLIKENLEKSYVSGQQKPSSIKGEFFDYQKSQFNFNEEQFSDYQSEDANSTILSNSQMMNKQRQNDSFSSNTSLSSIVVSKINGGSLNNNNNIVVTPQDSLKLNEENGAQMRKKYQIEKQYSIYSEDSLCKPIKVQQLKQQLNSQLQEATYSDNVSRQSSIRSLISLDKKINEMANRKQMIQNKLLNQPGRFQRNNHETNSNSSQFDDNERLLLLNWENYDEVMSQSSVASTSLTNNEPRHGVNKFINVNDNQKKQQTANISRNSNERRPETRLGFRPDEFFESESYDTDASVENNIKNRRKNIRDLNTDTESHAESESSVLDNTIAKAVAQKQLLPDLQQVSFRPGIKQNRDSERRKTTSDLFLTKNEMTNKNRVNQESSTINNEHLLTRNAISDLNVANFDLNLNEINFKQNNYFNGIYGDNRGQDQDKYKSKNNTFK